MIINLGDNYDDDSNRMMTILMIMNHDGVDNHDDNFNDMDGYVYSHLAKDDNGDNIAHYDDDMTTRPMMKT